MANIYEGSLITIAATWSNGSKGDRFAQARRPHRRHQLSDCGFYARIKTPSIQEVQWPRRNHFEWPLFSRGRVFQERYLSP
jgi:ribosomal protein L34